MCYVVIQGLSHVLLFVTSWSVAFQAPLSFIISHLLNFMTIELVMHSNHLILCHPLLFFLSLQGVTALWWWRGLCNSMKLWAMPFRATQHGSQWRVKTWSTGEGNGNPLQHSYLENPYAVFKTVCMYIISFNSNNSSVKQILLPSLINEKNESDRGVTICFW